MGFYIFHLNQNPPSKHRPFKAPGENQDLKSDSSGHLYGMSLRICPEELFIDGNGKYRGSTSSINVAHI